MTKTREVRKFQVGDHVSQALYPNSGWVGVVVMLIQRESEIVYEVNSIAPPGSVPRALFRASWMTLIPPDEVGWRILEASHAANT